MKFPFIPLILLTCATSLFPLAATAGDSAEPALSDRVHLIVGHGERQDYYPRIMAVRALGDQIRSSEVDALLDFLGKDANEDPLRIGHLNAVKNDVVNILLEQRNPPVPRLAEHLIDGFENSSMDAVWRDYCLQHMPHCVRLSRDETLRKELLSTLWGASESRESTFSGTALLALRTISRQQPGVIDHDKLTTRALKVARDESIPNPSRMAALQVAGPDPSVVDLSRLLAQDTDAHIMLRTSAVSVLGHSTSHEDRELLNRFSRSPDVRLRMAARAALEQQ